MKMTTREDRAKLLRLVIVILAAGFFAALALSNARHQINTAAPNCDSNRNVPDYRCAASIILDINGSCP
jgi:hypothetical protein